MTLTCDYDPSALAVWHVQAVGDADDLLASRFVCGGHLDSAKEVVGHGGREYRVTALDGDVELTTTEKFARFHKANPHIYPALVRLAREWVASTRRRRLGIAILWERLRWDLAVRTNEAPKLNNDYKAFYARMIMRQESDLSDIFEVRRSVADETLDLAS